MRIFPLIYLIVFLASISCVSNKTHQNNNEASGITKIDTVHNELKCTMTSLDGTPIEFIRMERLYLWDGDTIYQRISEIYPATSYNKEIEESDKDFQNDYYKEDYIGEDKRIKGFYSKEIQSIYKDYVTYKYFIYEYNKHMNGAAHGDEYSYYHTYNSNNEDDILYYEDILNESYKKNIDELIADEIIEYLKKEGWGPEDYITLSKWKENFIDSNLYVTRQSNLGENGLIFNFSYGNNDDINLPHYYDIKVEIPYSKLKRYLKPPFDKLAE